MPTSDYFRQAMDEAEKAFRVTAAQCTRSAAYVEGDPGNMTRVSVVVSAMPPLASSHEGGGRYLVACLSPYKTATPMTFDPTVHPNYVLEKLTSTRDPKQVNGGDLMGVTLCIRRAFELLQMQHPRETEEKSGW
jgi:hypothetical protein